MAKTKKKKDSKEETIKPSAMDEAREDIAYFPGGLPINLTQKTDNKTLEDELQSFIHRILEDELRSQEVLIERLEKSQKQYRGEREPKSFPWSGASNVSIPVTQWLVDNIIVRLITAIFGQKKVWVLKARKPEFVDLIHELEDGLDWWQKWIIDFKNTIFDPLLQCIKTGTGIIKINYEIKKKTIYRYATKEEIADSDIKKYSTTGEPVVKVPVTTYQGPTLFPIPREDFIISSEAKSVDDAYLVGFRKYLRKPEIEARIKAGLYRKGALKHLFEGSEYSGDEFDDVKKDRAEGQGKEISEAKDKPIELWELWFKYDVDGDGIEDDIVVVYHHDTKTILRAIYNPDFYGSRPFIDLIASPIEYCFDGFGLCDQLRDLQEVVDTLYNQTLDNRTLQNSLAFLQRDTAREEDWEFYPGVVVKVDDVENAIKQFEIKDPMPSAMADIGQAIQFMQFVASVSPEAMGQPTAERPVASEAMARLEQVGIKMRFNMDVLRRKISKIGMKALCQFAQYQPRFTYEVEDKDGLFQSKAIDFPSSYLEEGIQIDLMASSEMLNSEVRRQINIAVYQLLSQYLTNLASMIQAIVDAGVHPEMKKFILEISETGRKIVTRILEDFDIADADDLLKPLNEVIDLQNALMNPNPPGMGQTGGGGSPSAPPQAPPRG